MFSTVRYFIKTSIVFLILGLLSGLFMSFAKNIFFIPYGRDLVTAHAHIILIGSVMMMIMGVALWFFPRAEKEDKKYNPKNIYIIYWVMAVSTSVRFISQASLGFVYEERLAQIVTIASTFQVLAILYFFYSMWGRIRPVGSHLREAKGERF